MTTEFDDSPDANDIRQRMEEARGGLDGIVEAIAAGARDMHDWRTYVHTYPWVCIGVALALGYVIVPRPALGSRRHAMLLADLPNQHSRLATSLSTLRGMLLGIASDLVLRQVTSCIGQQVSRILGTKANKSTTDDQP